MPLRTATTGPHESPSTNGRGWDAAFEAARDAAPGLRQEQRFVIAGRAVRLETVGRRLHGFVTAAIRHLEDAASADRAHELLIRLWDAGETGVASPCGPLSGDPDEEEALELSADGRVVTDRRGQWAASLNRGTRVLTGCAAFKAPRPLLHDYGKPLQTLIAVWCHDLGAPLVHAGLVAREGRGVLFGGSGGSGKSTAALACLEAGFEFLGDDRIALERTGERFVGHSLFNSVLIDAGHFRRFPRAARHAIATAHPRERKPLAFLDQVYPGRMGASATVHAVALLRMGGTGRTRVRPARAAEALLHIAPSSLILPLGPGARGMTRMAELLRAVPGYWLELGSDVGAIPDAVAALLDGRPSSE